MVSFKSYRNLQNIPLKSLHRLLWPQWLKLIWLSPVSKEGLYNMTNGSNSRSYLGNFGVGTGWFTLKAHKLCFVFNITQRNQQTQALNKLSVSTFRANYVCIYMRINIHIYISKANGMCFVEMFVDMWVCVWGGEGGEI